MNSKDLEAPDVPNFNVYKLLPVPREHPAWENSKLVLEYYHGLVGQKSNMPCSICNKDMVIVETSWRCGWCLDPVCVKCLPMDMGRCCTKVCEKALARVEENRKPVVVEESDEEEAFEEK